MNKIKEVTSIKDGKEGGFSWLGRLPTRTVYVGDVPLGFGHPVVPQSMVLSDAINVKEATEEIIRLWERGSRIVRITAPSIESAQSLKDIKEELRKRGYNIPLVADIHFTPNAALVAVQYVEKVRINPGNYADKKKFEKKEYTDEEYNAELERVRSRFLPLVKKCKEYGRAMRIGVNHGSLSDRIMNRYGDTPEGMVESALEFIKICEDEGFYDIVVSMKASNPVVMIHAYRLLAVKMMERGRIYPVHVGVTEGGNGIPGRIKSAVGIGTLLMEGIGDTIRVSLTEPPENEIPVCNSIIECVNTVCGSGSFSPLRVEAVPPTPSRIPAGERICVIGYDREPYPDIVISKDGYLVERNNNSRFTVEREGVDYFGYKFDRMVSEKGDEYVIVNLRATTIEKKYMECVREIAGQRNIILKIDWGEETNKERIAVWSGVILGKIITDIPVSGVWGHTNKPDLQGYINEVSFGIVQALRLRMETAEYIACPGCGRTLFSLEEVTNAIKERTMHLKGLKIAVMGCIVNGLGEMADADYGYVGTGPGKVSLYRGKEVVMRNVPQEKALDYLVELIKKDGKWREP